jgi:hypothetical protein
LRRSSLAVDELGRIVKGVNGIEMRRALTFHCREIPSWLVGQEGHRQVE